MTPEEHLATLRAEGERMGSLSAEVLELPVPSCPGWTVDRLVGHTGRVHRWAATMLGAHTMDGDVAAGLRGKLPQPPSGPAVLDFYREALDLLVTELDGSDPDEPVWTFAGPDTRRFWFRRQAQELSVHRWDADASLSAGGAGPEPRTFEADLAADGVDEFLGLFLGRFLPPIDDGTEPTLHLHGTDDPAPPDGAEWLVRLTADGPVVTREHAKGDVALRGSAEDLLLVLWRRRELDVLDVVGDRSVAERVVDQTRVT
ncbi:MAG: hypothetical protein JWN46_2978 [Acidimicrobiales bacterium]|nr:hypothetical protein [Acidimicrobiales bacterium]